MNANELIMALSHTAELLGKPLDEIAIVVDAKGAVAPFVPQSSGCGISEAMGCAVFMIYAENITEDPETKDVPMFEATDEGIKGGGNDSATH